MSKSSRGKKPVRSVMVPAMLAQYVPTLAPATKASAPQARVPVASKMLSNWTVIRYRDSLELRHADGRRFVARTPVGLLMNLFRGKTC